MKCHVSLVPTQFIKLLKLLFFLSVNFMCVLFTNINVILRFVATIKVKTLFLPPLKRQGWSHRIFTLLKVTQAETVSSALSTSLAFYHFHCTSRCRYLSHDLIFCFATYLFCITTLKIRLSSSLMNCYNSSLLAFERFHLTDPFSRVKTTLL